MNSSISTNTQAILLLTAPLITGQNGMTNGELLTQGEYRRFARQLRDLGHAPADLLGSESAELLRELETVIPADRIRRLLDRGFLISQAIERWQSRAIWVLSRADSEYPKRIKNRLKEDSPAVLYGCGQPTVLEFGGLAVVGSRHVDESLIEYTEAVARQSALAKKSVISGGAQGIDRAAMRGALEAGGRVTGVLADSLERAALNRENRNWLLEEQLALVSPYDPSAGFNVGHAMQRNKVIYALADAALVVSAEFEKGGTWAGAAEQLQKLRFVPVYIRSTGEIGRGLQGLVRMGAHPWPNPKDSDQFLAVFGRTEPTGDDQQPQLAFQSTAADPEVKATSTDRERDTSTAATGSGAGLGRESDVDHGPGSDIPPGLTDQHPSREPAEALIGCVREILVDLLATPKSESEVASVLQVSNSQARLWLRKFVQEGMLKRLTRPARFVVRQKGLL
jgi:predicted Rossmann fold nucleotide-binding protein DprA/Smf involved in DNA uptake